MLGNENEKYNNIPRPGCKDLWNASFLKGAYYTEGNDIPICWKCNGTVPVGLIAYDDAKALHKRLISKDPNYHVNMYIHFYIDDQKFDGKRESIWLYPDKLIELLYHFDGVISPDFSTYADFPMFVKGNNFFRMRAFDYIFQQHGIPVIPNVRWGTSETWSYCFDGIPSNGIIAIGVVASGINKTMNRRLFKDGLDKALEMLTPHTMVIYGSDNYDVFDNLRNCGIKVIAFPSKTSLAYREGGRV